MVLARQEAVCPERQIVERRVARPWSREELLRMICLGIVRSVGLLANRSK
jgi:hypothetical protein